MHYVVAPPSFARDYRTKSSAGSRNGAKYRSASGNIHTIQGEKRFMMTTNAGEVPNLPCRQGGSRAEDTG